MVKNIGMAHNYPSIHDARLDLFKLGLEIKANGLPKEINPLVFTFVGIDLL
jgi:hypothetical protein